MSVSKAQREATKRYEDKNYDNVLVRLPKGTKEKIQATGESVNGFINRVVKEELKWSYILKED